MLRNIISSIFVLISSTFAMAEELSIIGIPLTGTIDQFTSNVNKQGNRVSSFSKQLPVGQRAFEVRYAGEDAILMVSYNPTSKRVYDATLTLSSFNESDLQPYYENFKTIISNKFTRLGKSSKGEIDQFHGKNMWRFFCFDEASNKIGSAYIYYWDIPADEEYDTIYQINLKIRNSEAPSWEEEMINNF